MYPFTHISIALGSVRGGDQLTRRKHSNPAPAPEIDYRMVALGSILPDLIDKPLKWFIFRKQLPDDHLWGHTLLFSASLVAAGLWLARRGDSRLLALGLGSLTHPFVDPVVERPANLFWPLFGGKFPRGASSPGLGSYSVPAEALLIAGSFLGHSKSETVRGWLRRLIRRGEVGLAGVPE
jgi:hypothetical protein